MCACILKCTPSPIRIIHSPKLHQVLLWVLALCVSSWASRETGCRTWEFPKIGDPTIVP